MIPENADEHTIVTLRGMQFNALVGILDDERTTAQPIEVDLVLTVTRGKGKIDKTKILDYRHAYALVSEILMAGHIDYLEEAAERIVTGSLALPLVKHARVAVRKTRVPLGGPLAYAEVAIERGRA